MKDYHLKIYPDYVLRERSFPVMNIDEEIHNLIEAMCQIMYQNRGIGLAAPQIGFLKRIIIADAGDGLMTLINPMILQKEEFDELEEGCLSLPGIEVPVKRNMFIEISTYNSKGKEIKKTLEGLTARVVQHEIDHLNGILIIDYSTYQKKNLKVKNLF
jgi:peptide deformylase